MSKLFETLETIKRRESAGFPQPDSSRRIVADGRRPIKRGMLTLLTIALLCGGLYYATLRLDFRPGSKIPEISEPKSRQPLEHPAAPSPSPGRSSKFETTNNTAVTYIRNQDHWRAIYLLTSLVEQYPDRIEPLINLGVALAEMGLWEPAQEYLTKARTMNPKHPLLIRNITMLRQAGLFDQINRAGFDEGGKSYD